MKLGLFLVALLWGAAYWLTQTRSKTVNHHLPELIAASGALAVATVAFFWQILLTPNHWMPAGGGDLAPFLYPNYRFAAAQLWQGVLPLWNPHLYSGTPFAADIQTGLFYPPNWLLFALGPNFSYESLEYLTIAHFWLAGFNMYLCLRWLDLPSPQPSPRGRGSFSYPPSPPGRGDGSEGSIDSPRPMGKGLGVRVHPLAALFGAIAFEFSDLFIVHFGNLNLIAVAAWLPLVFVLFQRSLSRQRVNLAMLSGAVLALATLAGHIQITLFILLALGWYALSELKPHRLSLRPNPTPALPFEGEGVSSPPDVGGIKGGLTPFGYLFITLMVMVGLSAMLLLPAYEMSRYTPRAELPYNEAARYSLPPIQLIGLLIPNYFGRDPALHWGPWDRVETGYIGILTLMLALMGLALSPQRLKYYFATLGCVALLLSLGGYSLVHGWLYALMPGFNQLRAPARFIFLLDFSLAALAAFGLQTLLSPLSELLEQRFQQIRRALTWGLGGLMVMALPLAYYAVLVTQDRDPTIFQRATSAATGAVIFSLIAAASLILLHLKPHRFLKPMRFGLTAIIILSLDLFTLGYNVDVGQTNPTEKFNHAEAIAFLKSDPSFYRIEVTTDVWHLWQPDTALIAGLYDVWGLYNPLTLADPTLYWSGAPPRNTGRYNFLGIKYIIASKAGAPGDGNIVPVFDQDPDINIYLNLDAANRLLFISQTTVVTSHEAAWEAIRRDEFNPTQTVVLESPSPLPSPSRSDLTSPQPSPSRSDLTSPQPSPSRSDLTSPQPSPSRRGSQVTTLALLQYNLAKIKVAIESDQAGYLVLADSYYPGWQATVDGQAAPIERANYAFRAVPVPAGAHTVEMVFRPMTWYLGLAISGLTALALVGWMSKNILKPL